MKFVVEEVIAVSCAVNRINNGFIKKSFGTQDQKSNSAYLYEHFCEGKTVDVTDSDQQQAKNVIEYLRGLGFKALERKLTDFERKVLGLVTSESVDKTTLGIAASLPNVYLNKIVADEWADRERELGATSEFVGREGTRSTFVAKVEFDKFIPKTESYLVTASVDNKHILKFFLPPTQSRPTVGQKYTIAGYVKPHAVNKHTGFKETMINRVKFDRS